ncbi:MAG TPA: SDR family oxidoreductase [Bryobacteraceae bacterium]|nr:SDR family oxidoreductase [Bryobacteraceae bacterium]
MPYADFSEIAAVKKVAIVTGAAQGIGRQTAELLARKGYALLLCDTQSCQSLAAEISLIGRQTVEVNGDIAAETTAKAVAETAGDRFGRVDVLVNNAGVSHICPAEKTTVEDWRRVLDVNLLGPFLLSREIGRLMLAQGSGSIVNVASIAGLLGIADRAAYNASKHGLIGLTRTLAAEWGGRGVRCNAVCPGWVKTPMDVAPQAAGFYSDSDIEGRVPMARFASPLDIASAIAFLADENQSGFVNGHTLSVDGGWFADGSWESLRLRHRFEL